MKFITQEELAGMSGRNARNYIGDLAYNEKSKEYMTIAFVPDYEKSTQYVIVVFSHGIKKTKLQYVKEGRVPASHIDKKVNWLSDKEAEPYLHYQKEMADFLAARDKPSATLEQKPIDVVPDKFEVLIRAAAAVNAKVWEYEFEGHTFPIIAKSAFGARRKIMKKLRKVTIKEIQC